MSISFLLNIDIAKPCPESHRYEGISYYTDDPELSKIEIGLIKFCHEYDSDVLMFFGERRMAIKLWHDVWDLITYDIITVISNSRNERKMSFDFIDYGCVISSCEYEDNTVKLKCREQGKICKEYFTKCDTNALIDELIKLVRDILTLAVKGGYVDREDSIEFLSKLEAADDSL